MGHDVAGPVSADVSVVADNILTVAGLVVRDRHDMADVSDSSVDLLRKDGALHRERG